RGAFAVALGVLQERDLGAVRDVRPGEARAFGPEYLHEVRNVSSAPAISVHAYSPPLTSMNRYELVHGRPVRLATEDAGQWGRPGPPGSVADDRDAIPPDDPTLPTIRPCRRSVPADDPTLPTTGFPTDPDSPE